MSASVLSQSGESVSLLIAFSIAEELQMGLEDVQSEVVVALMVAVSIVTGFLGTVVARILQPYHDRGGGSAFVVQLYHILLRLLASTQVNLLVKMVSASGSHLRSVRIAQHLALTIFFTVLQGGTLVGHSKKEE